MSVVTFAGHAKRARMWYNQEEIYFAIAKTTPWEDEDNPPIPVPEDTIEDIICLKKVEQKYYVLPDEHGTIYYRNVKYRILSEEEAIRENCRFVFVATWLNYDEVPTDVSYRQIGLFTDPKRAPFVLEGQYVLLPRDIVDYGTLEAIANDTETKRSANKRERIAMLVEF